MENEAYIVRVLPSFTTVFVFLLVTVLYAFARAIRTVVIYVSPKDDPVPGFLTRARFVLNRGTLHLNIDAMAYRRAFRWLFALFVAVAVYHWGIGETLKWFRRYWEIFVLIIMWRVYMDIGDLFGERSGFDLWIARYCLGAGYFCIGIAILRTMYIWEMMP